MKDKVIYTCMFGAYDDLKDPEIIRDEYDYICFSNILKQSDFKVWKIIKMKESFSNNVLLSRYPKLCPHLFLKDYTYSIYLDSNIEITGDYLYSKVSELIKKNILISLIKHPLRDCIYEEAKVCIEQGIDNVSNINSLISILKGNKYPLKNGLFENNIIFRQHNNEQIKKVAIEWWYLFLNYARRDQLSLCYLLWKNNISIALFMNEGLSARNNVDFHYKTHKKNYYLSFIRRLKKITNNLLK